MTRAPSASDLLRDAGSAAAWFARYGVHNVERGWRDLHAIAARRVPLPLLDHLVGQLGRSLAGASDADMALNNFERFVAAARSPLALAALFEREPSAIPILIRIFSTSQYLSDLLIRDNESYDALRLGEGQPLSRTALIDEVAEEIGVVRSPAAAMNLLRVFKQRQTLRIAYGDIVGQQQLDVVASQISYVAEAICAAALAFVDRTLREKYGVPRDEAGNPVGITVLALGKLGGGELNYSSDIDLMLFYGEEGTCDGPRGLSNREYFERLVREFVRLLSEPTPLGIAYRVDLRLRPDGAKGPLALAAAPALQYYDLRGRTWERQALIKARYVAGDAELARRMLGELAHWIYRSYLTQFEIQGIKALKRRIERRAELEGAGDRDVKSGRGGIRDIEFAIQFLQLLHGREVPEVRTPNTLQAIDRLQAHGCLTMQEGSLLHDHYTWLRKLEHRLQIMFDLQTHALPASQTELIKLAGRMDFDITDRNQALQAFRRRLHDTTRVNREILDHLLHNAFPSDENTAPAEEVDLVLDPEIAPHDVDRILSRYGFRDRPAAHRHLLSLADERIPFLNPRRCRHFLAAIAQPLLAEVALTPDPDQTLVVLDNVSNSLGGKAVLWELFSYNRASMELSVTLCATCNYLSDILTRNPGMIDGLLDSLTLKALPGLARMSAWLDELTQNAADVDAILHSFKNHMHVQIGVRDLMDRDDIRTTHKALTDVAELCLRTIARRESERTAERYGRPASTAGRGELIILALGKLAAREPNYHSDLDVIFLYDGDGTTDHPDPERRTSHQHYFSELGTRIIKSIAAPSPSGRLYEVDCRLRPTGKSGALAVSFEEFLRYFASGSGQAWERLALCKARPIFGSPLGQRAAAQLVHQALISRPWQAAWAAELRQMRYRMQEGASPLNLKRGIGGTVDIEFIVQLLQLKYAEQRPAVVRPGTVDALIMLSQLNLLPSADCHYLIRAYQFLRAVEARIRLMGATARHDFPAEPLAQAKLAYLLDRPSGEVLLREVTRYTQENRVLFERVFQELEADVR